jgi:hypothetical protein
MRIESKVGLNFPISKPREFCKAGRTGIQLRTCQWRTLRSPYMFPNPWSLPSNGAFSRGLRRSTLLFSIGGVIAPFFTVINTAVCVLRPLRLRSESVGVTPMGEVVRKAGSSARDTRAAEANTSRYCVGFSRDYTARPCGKLWGQLCLLVTSGRNFKVLASSLTAAKGYAYREELAADMWGEALMACLQDLLTPHVRREFLSVRITLRCCQ